ncbi:MAG: FMN-binding protein [Propionicimonas sp.]
MRRITLTILSTISAVILLFSYRTSTNQATALSPNTEEPSSTSSSATAGGTTVTPSATPSGSSSSDSSSSDSSSSGASTSSGTGTLADGTYTGDSVNTRWGAVQVQITVSGGQITAADAVDYPSENGRDQEINAYAIPVLNDEVTEAQSANIDAVSGATVTSGGYIDSLQSAIDAARQ